MSDSHSSIENDDLLFNEASLREQESVPGHSRQEIPVFDDPAEEARYMAYVNLNEFLAREQEGLLTAEEVLIGPSATHQGSFFSMRGHDVDAGPSIIELPSSHREESLTPPVSMPRMRAIPVQARRRVPRRAQGKNSNKEADMAKMLAEFKKLENYQLPLLMAELAEEPTPNPEKAQFASDLMVSTFAKLTVSKKEEKKEE